MQLGALLGFTLLLAGCTVHVPPGPVELSIKRGHVDLHAGAVSVQGDVEGFTYSRKDPGNPPPAAPELPAK